MRRAFTLIERLVVISIIALLIALLLPALNRARAAGQRGQCLSNMRQMEMAHMSYASDRDGEMIRAGLPHGTSHKDLENAWFNTLKREYGNQLVLRCPTDESPYWDNLDEPVRLTSYGINTFLDPVLTPLAAISTKYRYRKVDQVPAASATVHFIEMAREGEFATADHPHPFQWAQPAPYLIAATQLAIDAHGGEREPAWTSVANYGYLDGHASTHQFDEVFKNFEENRFDPRKAR
jgi:prepilin-type N-terminal cleavage/methylation domain-containing protein/prepilin-type processing-associated H-X9-DG protein